MALADRCRPSASISVDLPTPGAPVMPMRSALPVCGRSSAITSRASAWWSARVDSASVIAFAEQPAVGGAHARHERARIRSSA